MSALRTIARFCAAVVCVVLFLAPKLACAAPPAFAWAEGEQPTEANFTFEAQAPLPEILSGGKWLARSVEKAKVAKEVPAEGFLLKYRLRVPEDGEYTVWARVGYEFVRSPLEWRIGDGAWTKAGAEVHTTSLMRLAFFTEVAWEAIGKAPLRAGNIELQIRYREPNRDGAYLIGLDALALVKGNWVPEGRLKPGDSYDSAADRAAANEVFAFPALLPDDRSTRIELPLSGLWQVARYDDPDMDKNTYDPVRTLPAPDEYPLHWMGVNVPSSAWNKPELAFGHRLLYRTRVAVPSDLNGRGFFLHFSGTTWIVSVFVNGTFVGAHRGVLVPWDMDISRAVRPGEANEIVVAVKGSWYALDRKGSSDDLEHSRNLPNDPGPLQWARWVAPIYPSTKGEGDGRDYGLVNPVKLIVTGSAYVSDVFVRPSVAKKRLDADVTVTNPGAEARQLTVQCAAVNAKTGQIEQTFPLCEVRVPAGAEQTVVVGGAWEKPKLWWPVDNPNLYKLRTTLRENGPPIDVFEQRFGFREVTLDGIHIRLNGVIRNFWNWVEVSGSPKSPEDWLKAFRAEGNRYYRFSADSLLTRFLPTREAQLDFFDRNGIPGRLSTCVDGMFITYNLDNPRVWENFREHIEQVTKAYRNHPSVVMVSVENELMYINAQNTGQIDAAEPKLWEIVQKAKALDPTKPFMADGAGAMKGNRLDINCEHYPEAPIIYNPESAYTFAPVADHSSRWPWDHKRPLILGETFFYAGKLEDQAWIGGDRVFRGRDAANVGASRYVQLLVEGYRWQGVAGICPWVAVSSLPGAGKVFSDLAVFPRKRAHRLTAGRTGSILVKALNDTLSNVPVTFEWTATVGAKVFASGRETLTIEAGTGQERVLKLTPPPITRRMDGTLTLRLSQNGVVGFEDRLPLTLLPPVTQLPGTTSALLLYDRSNRLLSYLRTHGVNATPLTGLNRLKGRTGFLLVGPDSLTPDEAAAPGIMAFAARGGRVLLLEQENPLAGTGLPGAIRATGELGGYAFPQALGRPLFANILRDDLTDWAGDAPTFKHAYLKPSGGARSLVECGNGLNYSALVEAPCGQGVIVASQLRIGAKLGLEPAAEQMLQNLLTVYESYTPARGVVAALSPVGSPVQKALAATGVLTKRVESVAQALNPREARVAVIPATGANLLALQSASGPLQKFTNAGGWVMLWGLQPKDLAAYNRLVGENHSIRPFRLERVTLESPENPLAATLGNRDLTLYSPREIMFGDYFLSDTMYSCVVGSTDAAPFCKMPDGPDDPLEYKPTYSDNDPYNYVNGLLNSDSWRYIRQIGINEKGASGSLTFGFRQPAVIRQINLWNNVNYATIENLDIVFDDDEAHPLHVTLPANGSVNEIKVEPARRVKKSITLGVRSSRRKPDDHSLVGLDNVQFLRQLPPETMQRVQPLDNIGGLVVYPRGKGGILLNQIRLMDDEPNPENIDKKLRLVATLLQNMGAGARSSEVMLPGVNVQYAPVDITRWCNRHLKANAGQPGWFGENGRDLSHLKVGTQYLADIQFHLPDYVNAPVPQSIMLGNPDAPEPLRSLPTAVDGIAVEKKADALFFLHTALVTRPPAEWEKQDRGYKAPELFRYVVHYADGTMAEIPVRYEEQVDNWLQKTPRALSAARVAWSAPFPDAKPDDPRPVLYAMAWNNPKPDVAIRSVDVKPGKDGNRAVPAVLAITVGSAKGRNGKG